jgi:hypothetical protein
MTRFGAKRLGTGRRLGALLLPLLLLQVLGTAACGGEGPNAAGVVRWSATASPLVAASGRLTVEEQLVLLDAPQPPLAYAEVLTILTQKCRESRTELAAAIAAARRALVQERGVTVAALDYLRGVDAVVPAGSREVDCTAVATELGQMLGR